MKNQKMSLVRIATVSGGYSHNRMCACTTLYHSLMLLLPCQKVVNTLKLAQTALDCGLQKSSNFDHIVCNVTSSVIRAKEMYISSPASSDHWITFLIFSTFLKDSKFTVKDVLTFNFPSYKSGVEGIIYGPVHFQAFNIGYHHSRILERWMRGLIMRNCITWRCCCCTFFSVGFLSCRSWFSIVFLDVLVVWVMLNLLLHRLGWSFHWILCDGESAGSSLVGLDVKSRLLHVWDAWIGGVYLCIVILTPELVQ